MGEMISTDPLAFLGYCSVASLNMLLWLFKNKKDSKSVLLGHTLESSGGTFKDLMLHHRPIMSKFGRSDSSISIFKKFPREFQHAVKVENCQMTTVFKTLCQILCSTIKSIRYMYVYGSISHFYNMLFLRQVIFLVHLCPFKQLKIKGLAIWTHNLLYLINCPL